MSLKERLRQMDGVSVSKEFRVYTMHGAVLSVATLLMILYLVISEVYFNFQVILKETVHVNATSPAGLEMEFDITLPKISCSKLHIDANDQQGQSQSLHLDRQHHVWKHRIKMKGERKIFIGRKERLELGSTLKEEQDLVTALDEEGKVGGEEVETKDADDGDGAGGCGSCYGAGDEGECCDTCEDVRRAYKRKGWVLRDVSEIKQCQREATASPNDQDGEGCNVHGVVALSTGGGNLHLAPGKGAAEGGVTILDALIQSFQEWNVSHTIHKIRFGAEHPSAVYQLDDATRTIADSYGMYQYYLQLVPTLYRFQNGTTIQTYQYSVTEHLRHVSPGSNRGLPGVWFFYEVSPLHVEINEGYRKGWIAFFTSVSAIVGGVVTVMGMVDQFLFSSKQHKTELRRFSSIHS